MRSLKYIFWGLFFSILIFGCRMLNNLTHQNDKIEFKKDTTVVKQETNQINDDGKKGKVLEESKQPLDVDGDGVIDKPNYKDKPFTGDRKPGSVDSKDKIDDQTTVEDFQDTSKGLIAYSVPEEMQVGNVYDIKLRISKEKNKVELVKGDMNIPITNDTTSKIMIESIRVEPIMSAQLLCEKDVFEITSSSSEVQDIENRGYTEWEWFVKPLVSGNNYLKMVVKIKFSKDGQDVYKDITVYDKSIHVKSNLGFTIKGFISSYWQWLITTLILPFIIWLYNRKKKKENSEIS